MPDLATVQIITAGALLVICMLSILVGERSILVWTWAAFCLSAAASLVLRGFGDGIAPAGMLLLAPASATCGAAWLLARAIFRKEQPFGPAHLGAVAVIAAVNLAPETLFGATLANLQSLLASTVIVLTLWEALRGWTRDGAIAEKVMRAAFLGVTGSAVLVAVVWLGAVDAGLPLQNLVQTLALLAVTSVAGACVFYRLAFAANADTARQPVRGGAKPRAVDPELKRLGARLDALVRSEALFLDCELKVADLARKLQTPEYKVTRAITGALDAPNFNQYINRFRVDFARQLMAEDPARPILAVAFDCGFASIGPFNRAFKALTGQTPRTYRAGLDASQVLPA